jgi:hypothetical protein
MPCRCIGAYRSKRRIRPSRMGDDADDVGVAADLAVEPFFGGCWTGSGARSLWRTPSRAGAERLDLLVEVAGHRRDRRLGQPVDARCEPASPSAGSTRRTDSSWPHRHQSCLRPAAPLRAANPGSSCRIAARQLDRVCPWVPVPAPIAAIADSGRFDASPPPTPPARNASNAPPAPAKSAAAYTRHR